MVDIDAAFEDAFAANAGTPDVVIVGGGVAGLVAARELAQGGLRVVVCEASGTWGGKVVSHTVGGLSLDAGAESFATRRGTVAELLQGLGLADDVVTPNPAGAWLQPATGNAHPLPKTGILGIPGTPMAADVITAVGFSGALRAQLDSILPGIIGSREEYLGPFVRKRMGRRVLDRLVTPVAMGIHSRHPDQLLVDSVAPGLRAALKQQESLAHAVLALRAAAPAGTPVAGIAGGIHRIVDTLVEDLRSLGADLRQGTRVATADDQGVTIDGGERITARAVVLATALDASDEGAGAIVLATLVVNSAELDAAPRGTGVLVASEATHPQAVLAKSLTHATAKWAWLAEQAGSQRHVLRLSYDAVRLGQRDLCDQARTDAELLLGVSIPAASVIGFARVEWGAPPAARTLPQTGVTRIGEAVAGTGLAAVIGQARSTAAAILSNFAGTADGRGDDGHHDA